MSIQLDKLLHTTKETLELIPLCVKEKFEKSYKDIPDEKFTEVVEYIDHLKKNPSWTKKTNRTFRQPPKNVCGLFGVNRIL